MKLAGDKSRHISIRYFFIKGIMKREHIDLVHCPTERMIADFYTKPLQGSLFKKMRDIVMGLAPFPDEERVEIEENMSKVASVECGSKYICSTEPTNLGAKNVNIGTGCIS